MKKVTIEVSEDQYKIYQQAADQLNNMGIAVSPENLIRLLALYPKANVIADEYLTRMRTLINEGKKQLREQKGQDKS